MWFIAALAAAILWGFSYAMSERFLKQGFQPSFIMFLHAVMAVPAFAALTLRAGKIESQLALFKQNPKSFLILVFVVVCYLMANQLVFWSIGQKNATSVSLIEIAYPLFTAFFAWALFRDVQINWGITAGAALIISGILCVGYFSKG